ncbi:hypothetical protein VTI74DRAFT_8467 [Chaetomium olivicolor]
MSVLGVSPEVAAGCEWTFVSDPATLNGASRSGVGRRGGGEGDPGGLGRDRYGRLSQRYQYFMQIDEEALQGVEDAGGCMVDGSTLCGLTMRSRRMGARRKRGGCVSWPTCLTWNGTRSWAAGRKRARGVLAAAPASGLPLTNSPDILFVQLPSFSSLNTCTGYVTQFIQDRGTGMKAK